MGNCFGSKSASMVCAANDYEESECIIAPAVREASSKPNSGVDHENEKVIRTARNRTVSSAPSHGREQIKIKISKKQYEDLIGRSNVQHVPVHQVLCSLLKDTQLTAKWKYYCRRLWKPTLVSIPENGVIGSSTNTNQ